MLSLQMLASILRSQKRAGEAEGMFGFWSLPLANPEAFISITPTFLDGDIAEIQFKNLSLSLLLPPPNF